LRVKKYRKLRILSSQNLYGHYLTLPSLRHIIGLTVKEVLEMAARALNFKMDEAIITDMKDVAGVYHMSMTDLIKEAIMEKLTALKSDPFYRLTARVEEASAEETEEILADIESLSDDDLTIATTKRFTV
jgi:hypothetical protein